MSSLITHSEIINNLAVSGQELLDYWLGIGWRSASNSEPDLLVFRGSSRNQPSGGVCRVGAAAMGFIGIFSYVGAAIQENISAHLIESGVTMVGNARIYDFDAAIAFWIGSSVVSMIHAASLWRTKVRD